MSGLLKFGFVRADKTSIKEEIPALKTVCAPQEAIGLQRMKRQSIQARNVVPGNLDPLLSGEKSLSTTKDGVRKRKERC